MQRIVLASAQTGSKEVNSFALLELTIGLYNIYTWYYFDPLKIDNVFVFLSINKA